MVPNNPPKDTGTRVAFARASLLASNTEQWVLALQVGTFLTRLAAARVLFSLALSALLWDVRNKALPEPILIAQLPNSGYQRDPPGSTLLGGDSLQTLEMWTNNTAGVTVYSSPRRFLHS